MSLANPTLREAAEISEDLQKDGTKYLHAVLRQPPQMLWLQMGPYCNMACRHCYHDYGPHREGRMQRDIVDAVGEQLPQTSIDLITAGEGEPFFDQELLEHMVSTFQGLEIMTNGYWGDSYHNARRRLEGIQEAGFDLARIPSRVYPGRSFMSALGVSADDFHGRQSYEHAVNIAEAFRDVFEPDHRSLSIQYTSGRRYTGEEFIDNKALRFFLLRPLRARLDAGELRYRSESGIMKLMFEQARWLQITLSELLFVGRAQDIGGTPRQYAINDIRHPKQDNAITVDSKGDVFFSGGLCRNDNLYYGNVFESNLHDITEEMMHDPLLKVLKIGDIGGLLNIIRRMGGPETYPGSSPCEICRAVLSDVKLLETVRKALNRASFSDDEIIGLVYAS